MIPIFPKHTLFLDRRFGTRTRMSRSLRQPCGCLGAHAVQPLPPLVLPCRRPVLPPAWCWCWCRRGGAWWRGGMGCLGGLEHVQELDISKCEFGAAAAFQGTLGTWYSERGNSLAHAATPTPIPAVALVLCVQHSPYRTRGTRTRRKKKTQTLKSILARSATRTFLLGNRSAPIVRYTCLEKPCLN
jgi:hypothetical protein